MKRIKILYMHDDGRDIPDVDAVILDEGEAVCREVACKNAPKSKASWCEE